MAYRVYDKKKKKFIQEDVYLTPEGELLKSDKSIFGWTKPTFVSQDRYVYQQSINLPDKNGIMIHIGDHIKAQVNEDKEVTGIVTYAEELSAYIMLCFDVDEYYTLGTDVCDNIEIVGNCFDK